MGERKKRPAGSILKRGALKQHLGRVSRGINYKWFSSTAFYRGNQEERLIGLMVHKRLQTLV